MANRHLIDLAYEIALSDFGKENFTFDEIWKRLVKKSKPSNSDAIGVLYSEMLQDYRFIFIGDNKWTLKENLTTGDIKKYKNALYGFGEDSLVEDGTEVDDSSEVAVEE
jgi:DNA-directed RNA polymerase delta subunit